MFNVMVPLVCLSRFIVINVGRESVEQIQILTSNSLNTKFYDHPYKQFDSIKLTLLRNILTHPCHMTNFPPQWI